LFAKTQVEIITTWGTIAILIIFLFVFYKKSMSK
jgi:cbb3-type cytochrome oxidase subunit 3